MTSALHHARWSPVPLPAGAHEIDIAHFPVDRTRNAVNQGGVGGFPNGANWRANPTAMPVTTTSMAPGQPYGCHLSASQPYRATAGFRVVITPAPTLPNFAKQVGGPQSGGVSTANAVQQRVMALMAMRQRVAAKRRVRS